MPSYIVVDWNNGAHHVLANFSKDTDEEAETYFGELCRQRYSKHTFVYLTKELKSFHGHHESSAFRAGCTSYK